MGSEAGDVRKAPERGGYDISEIELMPSYAKWEDDDISIGVWLRAVWSAEERTPVINEVDGMRSSFSATDWDAPSFHSPLEGVVVPRSGVWCLRRNGVEDPEAVGGGVDSS